MQHNIIRLDNRGLTPPEPMVRILEAVEHLAPGERIEALLDRRPVFLFPELDARALPYTCDPREDGTFVLVVGPRALTREEDVTAALGSVLDPELGIDVVNLGLLYGVHIEDGLVTITMTLTMPGCPMQATVTADVSRAVRALPWVRDVALRLTYEPPWTPERLTPLARLALGR